MTDMISGTRATRYVHIPSAHVGIYFYNYGRFWQVNTGVLPKYVAQSILTDHLAFLAHIRWPLLIFGLQTGRKVPLKTRQGQRYEQKHTKA